MGLIHVKELERASLERILEARSRSGNFLHLQDFLRRTGIGMEQANILIRIGALRFTGKNKKELLWEANFLHKKIRQVAGVTEELFVSRPLEFRLPKLEQTFMEDAMDEIAILGFPLCDPFLLVDADPAAFVPAKQLAAYLGKEVQVLGYYVTQKPVRTIKGETMQFGTFIDPLGDWMDTVHFPDVTNRSPLAGKGFYQMKGKVVEDFGVFSIEVKWLRKVGLKAN
jgi:DNA polymerase-3 subunit alpha